jgi:hypothetical protein
MEGDMWSVVLGIAVFLAATPSFAWELVRSTDRMTRVESVWIEQESAERFETGRPDRSPAHLVVRCSGTGPSLEFFGWRPIAREGNFSRTRWRLDPTDQVGELVWHALSALPILAAYNNTPQMPGYPSAWQAPVVTELLRLMLQAETMTIEIEPQSGPSAYPTFALAGLRAALEGLEGGRCIPKD